MLTSCLTVYPVNYSAIDLSYRVLVCFVPSGLLGSEACLLHDESFRISDMFCSAIEIHIAAHILAYYIKQNLQKLLVLRELSGSMPTSHNSYCQLIVFWSSERKSSLNI